MLIPTSESIACRVLQFLNSAGITPAVDAYLWEDEDTTYDSWDLLDRYNEWAQDYHRARLDSRKMFDELWQVQTNPPAEVRTAAVQQMYSRVYGQPLSALDAQLALRRAEEFSINAWASLGVVWLLDHPGLQVVKTSAL